MNESNLCEKLIEVIDLTKRYILQQKEIYGKELWGDLKINVKEKARVIPKFPSLDKLYQYMKECHKCPLGSLRTNLVFGVGNPNAKMVLIGEAPGRDEDIQGEPFVGRAGQLLNRMLIAINLKREDVYIANILKCRPPSNREPLESEVELCLPYLIEQLKIIKPKIILALGRIAVNSLFKAKMDVKNLRGKILDFKGIKMIVTYHPAALLRNPQFKRPAWEDLQMVKRIYDES
jgi:DNA polymerase